LELLNTAIENLVDVIAFKYNYNAKKIKDIAAAATLTLTLASIAIGLIIFIPHLITFFESFS
jgi:undecaprenol kinase/diacylglycerol kinase (ATP)